MNRGLGSPMQSPPDQSQMMAQGLGSMNAGNMENPGFAGGGIVPYASGGSIVAFDEGGITAANVKKELPKTWEEVRAESLAGSEETVEGLEKQIALQDAIDKRLRLGKYGDVDKLKESQVTRIESAVGADEAQQADIDRRAYYAEMGQIASEQGTRDKKAPTFLDVLSRSQKGAVDREQKRFEDRKKAVKAAEDARITLEDAREARRAGDLTTYRTKVAEAKKLQDKATEKIADASEKERESKFSRETQLMVADRQKSEADRLIGDLRRAKTPEERERISDMIEASKGRDFQGTSDRALYNRLVQKAYESLLVAQQNGDKDAEAAAQAELNRILKAGPNNLSKLGNLPPNVVNPQTPTASPSRSNWD
jgi:hypothetical protein